MKRTATPLSREVITAAALRVADAHGIDHLSMRKVAADLGVQAMSLYHHVANKEELLDALHEALVLDMPLTPNAPTTWDDGVRALAGALHHSAHTHPRLFLLLATRSLTNERAIAHLMPAIDAILRSAGDSTLAQSIAHHTVTALSGILLAEVGSVPGHEKSQPTSAEKTSPKTATDNGGGHPQQGSDQYAEFVEVLIVGFRARYGLA